MGVAEKTAQSDQLYLTKNSYHTVSQYTIPLSLFIEAEASSPANTTAADLGSHL